jgi:hypothetical protein
MKEVFYIHDSKTQYHTYSPLYDLGRSERAADDACVTDRRHHDTTGRPSLGGVMGKPTCVGKLV